MGQLARHQVGYGDQVANRGIAAGASLCRLDQGVGPLDPTVVEAAFEPGQNPRPVPADGLGSVLNRFKSAAHGPAIPLGEGRFGLA